MNIGFVSHSAELAGAERSLLDAIEVLVEAGARATVCLPREGPLCDRLSAYGVRWSIIPYRWWSVRYRKSTLARAARHPLSCVAVAPLARFLSSSKCDVVFTNSETVYSGALAAKLLGKPHVWQLREYRDAWRFDFGSRMSAEVMRRTTRCFIANSNAVRESYLPHLGEAEILVVYPYVKVVESPSPPPPPPRPASRTMRCLIAGTLVPHKRQQEAIEAIRHLRESGFAASLDMIGSVASGMGWYRRDLEETVGKSGLGDAVRFLGYVDDPLPLIADADALIQTSREPFGRTVIEAMSVGTPVVASDCGAARELVSHGVTGLLYEPGNARELAECIRRVSENHEERSSMVTAARASVGERFSRRAFRDGLMNTLESVL